MHYAKPCATYRRHVCLSVRHTPAQHSSMTNARLQRSVAKLNTAALNCC